MSLEPRNIKGFDAGDFARYHTGKMTPAEMHAIEKAALEDPFLADALDGFERSNSPEKDMSELRDRISSMINDKKKSPVVPLANRFSWLKVAAVLILLGGFAWIFYKQRSSIQDDISLARNKVQQNSPQLPAEQVSTVTDSNSSTLQADNALKDDQRDLGKATPVPQLLPKSPGQEKENDDINNNSKDFVLNDAKAAQPITESAGIKEKSDALTAPATGTTIHGKVTDEDGNVVAFATVTDQRKKAATTTDASGSFDLKSTDSIAKVQVTAPGYAPVIAEVGTGIAKNEIVLREADYSLAEVVVSTVPAAKKKSAQTSSISKFNLASVEYFNAEPAQGNERLNLVADSLKKLIPPAQLRRGLVVVDFDVDRDGAPVKSRVSQPVSPFIDSVALKTLDAGSPWKQPKKKKKSNVRIRF